MFGKKKQISKFNFNEIQTMLILEEMIIHSRNCEICQLKLNTYLTGMSCLNFAECFKQRVSTSQKNTKVSV